MRADNAQDFAHAIMKEDDDVVTDTKSADIIEEKEDEIEDTARLDDEDQFDGLEGTYNLSSTYFDVFDNLMRKYVGDLNTRDELQAKLAKELGKQSIFLYQRLT